MVSIFNDIIIVSFPEEVTFELIFVGNKFTLSHLSDLVKTGSQSPVKAEEIASFINVPVKNRILNLGPLNELVRTSVSCLELYVRFWSVAFFLERSYCH